MGLIYGLVAMGVALVWGVMGIINFAHGEFLMYGMYISFWFYMLKNFDPLFSIPFGIIGVCVLAILSYRIAIKRILGSSLLTTLLATFALSLILKHSAQYFWGPDYRIIFCPLIQGSICLGNIYISLNKLIAASISLVAIILLYLFLSKTELGLSIQAVSLNKEASLLVGIKVEQIYLLTFAIAGATAGLAGVLFSSFFPVSPQGGSFLNIIAFTCVALGGFGSITGAMLGGLIIGISESLAGFYIGPAFQYAVVFLIYLLVILFKPRGLMGW
jgi:branched-chain amino acid transport system permease protein